MKFKKITTGFVIQGYITLPDGTMVCQKQGFIAGDQVDYEDEAGNPIKLDTAKEIYFPFEMVQPKQSSQDGLKFVCPDCQGERLECCEDGPYTSEVLNIDDEGDFEYGPIDASGEVDRFQCLDCGYVLMDDNYPISDNQEVVEWIKQNCPQNGSYIDPRYRDDNADKYENE